MQIDWIHFTPWAALAGGLMLGVAVAAFVLLSGRVLGISGILAGMLNLRPTDMAWRTAFLLGLVLAPSIYFIAGGEIHMHIEAGWGTLILAGLLVGAGTSCASGCTSGHGVCGLSRLSGRSLVATLCFMGAGFSTVYLLRHVIGA